jgi:hypothetical protein
MNPHQALIQSYRNEIAFLEGQIERARERIRDNEVKLHELGVELPLPHVVRPDFLDQPLNEDDGVYRP